MPRWKRASPDEPAELGSGNGHHSKEERSTTARMGEERLRRLITQNERLELETQARKGNLVELATIKQHVLAANHTVKQHLLAIPSRIAAELVPLTDAPAIEQRLRMAISEALNELAYEHGGKL